MASSDEFAIAFGNSLAKFFEDNEITEARASKITGIGKATINTYTHDPKKGKGKRRKPSGEHLLRLCADLNFAFEYKGYKVTKESLANGSPNGRSISQPTPKQ